MKRIALALLLSGATLVACESSPKVADTPPPVEEVKEEAPKTEEPKVEDKAPDTEAATLDGKKFEIKTTDPAGKVDPDTLMFAANAFDSTACKEFGFSAASYTTTADGAKTSFEATTSSDKEGKITWKGVIEGDKISGTYDWVKDGQPAAQSTFEGALAAQ